MQNDITKCLGLVVQYNPLQVSPGALSQADNAVIRRENVIENRRGYLSYGTTGSEPAQLMSFNQRVLAHNGTSIAYDNGSGTFSNYSGSFSAPSGRKMRYQESNSNLYITTSTGIQVLMDTAGTAARLAGAPRALDSSTSLTGSTGFLANNTQTAYRTVVVRIDQNNNTLYGYPSQRAWVTNISGGARNVSIVIPFPSEVIAGDIIQIYRTATSTYSAGGTDGAGDEMYLVYQQTLAAADIVTGSLTVTDVLIDGVLTTNAKLYTNASQEGITQANARPPLAKDIALYKTNIMMYANTSTKQSLFFSMVTTTGLGTQQVASISSGNAVITLSAANANIVVGMQVFDSTTPANITAGTTVLTYGGGTSLTLSAPAAGTGGTDTLQFITSQTITLSGTTYSFSNTENSATGKVGVSTTGVVANDIELTASSLIRVINRYATNTTIYAYSQSTSVDFPGQIYIEERTIGGSAFTFTVSNTAISSQFYPSPSTSTTTQSTSTNSSQKNALFFSKIQQVEAVPLLNYVLVGPANTNILRIKALRDSLIIVKEEGVYRLTGETPQNFSVIPLDLTTFCKATDSVTTLANQVFMLCNQGVVAISDTGVSVVSRDIEPKILPLLTFSTLATKTYGASYESERSYFLSTVDSNSASAPNQIYVYNVFTRAWTRWTFGFTTAVVEPNADFLYFATSGNSKVFKERKAFTNTDYADPESSITITSISGSTVSFSATTTPQAGYVISQAGTQIKILTLSPNGSNWTAVMATTPPAAWVAGAATIFPGIIMTIEWDAWSGGQPGLMKLMRYYKVLTDNLSGNNTISSLFARFRTDLDNTVEELEIFSNNMGWGSGWGVMPWGGISENFSYPLWTPRNKAYFRILNSGVKHQNAQEKISITGCSHTYEMVSERVSK